MADPLDLDADQRAVTEALLSLGCPTDVAETAGVNAACGDWTHIRRGGPDGTEWGVTF